MNERLQRYVCAHCEARPPRGDYMVHDAVWAKAGMRQGFLCLGCLEKRLFAAGHGPLQLDDFTRVPSNAGLFFGYAMATRVAAAATAVQRTPTCQHFVSGSQATGVDKDACSKRAIRRVLDFALYDLVNPVVCGRHALFWKHRGFNVIALETA